MSNVGQIRDGRWTHERSSTYTAEHYSKWNRTFIRLILTAWQNHCPNQSEVRCPRASPVGNWPTQEKEILRCPHISMRRSADRL